jgi:signal peptide peptidase SppA
MNPILKRFLSDIPFLSEGAAISLFQQLEPMLAEHPALTAFREKLKPNYTVAGGVATIPVEGVLARKPDVFEMAFYGVEDSGNVLDMVQRAANDPEVKGILLAIDSPGGFLTGGPEVADAVSAAGKPSVAWSGGMMASLAYWIGSQADEVIASRSALVGSIGVYAAFADYTKRAEAAGIKVEVFKNAEGTFKAAGLPGTSLTDAQRTHIQAGVQATFADFKSAVVSARPAIPAGAMQGQTFSGQWAKDAGLIDRIGDQAYAVGVLRGMIARA